MAREQPIPYAVIDETSERAGSWASARFLGTGELTPNGTYFTPVTRSVSEGNKGITSLVIALAYAAG